MKDLQWHTFLTRDAVEAWELSGKGKKTISPFYLVMGKQPADI
jgi:hypothetical protein